MNKIFYFLMIAFTLNALELPNNFKASFNQTIIPPKGDKVEKIIKYTGILYFSIDKIKWDYLSPVEKTVIVYNMGKKSINYIIEPEIEQVIIKKTKSFNIGFELQKIEESKLKQEKEFYSIIFNKNNKDYSVMFTKGIDGKYIPINIKYQDQMENLVEIKFYKINTNIDIDEAFEVKIPEYYDIIKN